MVQRDGIGDTVREAQTAVDASPLWTSTERASGSFYPQGLVGGYRSVQAQSRTASVPLSLRLLGFCCRKDVELRTISHCG